MTQTSKYNTIKIKYDSDPENSLDINNDYKVDYEIDYNDLIIERNIEVKKIHSEFIEINQLFKDMALIVNDSSEKIDNIMMNVEETKNNIDQGNNELKKADQSQNSASLKNKLLAAFGTIIGISAILGIVFGIKK